MSNREARPEVNGNGEVLQLWQLTPRERLWVENFGGHESPASLELAQDYIKLLRGKVYEIGCASGRVLGYLTKKRNVEVSGCDINRAEVKAAQRDGYRVKQMDGRSLKYPDNNFDHVVMVGVIGGVELDVRKGLLKEALRVIKPGGTVAVAEFKKNDSPEKQKKYEEAELYTGESGTRIIKKNNKVLFIAKHFTEDELIELFAEAGFSSIQTRGESIESLGIGDGMVEARRQYTVWGTKPLSE